MMKRRPLSEPNPSENTLMTVLEVADFFRVKQRCVWLWVAQGILPEPLRIGKRIARWRRAEIEAVVAKQARQEA